MKIWGTTDPSVNKMILFESNSDVQREEDLSTEEGFLAANNIGGIRRIYYFLYAARLGREITEQETAGI